MKKSNFSILKLLIFLMFFLVILTLFLLLYIIPVMKKYKTNKLILNKYEKVYKKSKNEVKFLKKKKSLLKEKYKKSLTKYNQNFDKNDFISFIKDKIKNLKITKVKDKNLLHYSIEGEIDKIYNFTKIVESLNSYKNIVKATFPITIEKDKKSYKIFFNVTIINRKLK